MRYYSITSKDSERPLNRTDVPEPSMQMFKRLFQETDGIPLDIVYTHTISDRPFQRKPTDEELNSGQYNYGDYVQTTAADGIM